MKCSTNEGFSATTPNPNILMNAGKIKRYFMNKIVSVLLATTLLNGCALDHTYQLDLISRDKSGNGFGNAQTLRKQIKINLNGQMYQGTYVYDGMKVINTTSSASANAYSGLATATAYGNGHSSTYIPGSGNGRVLATSGNNSIRCDFNYSGGTGIGYCQDNSGKEYDLIIH
jgi:hypothetical protein